MNRREFFKEAGVLGSTGLILSLFPWLESCTSKAQKEVEGEKARVAIIGSGSRGQFHINHLLTIPTAEVVALCDVYQPHLDAAGELCPTAKKYTDYRDVLADKNVDGVIICTPLNLHGSMTVDGLNAGKHVFCEKAMAFTMQEALNMYNTWKATGKILFVGQQRLFDPKYINAFSMIHNGDLGEIVGLRNYWFRNNDWRRPVPSPEYERLINWRLYRDTSCGLMTELACHQLQNGSWAMGILPDCAMGSGDIMFWKDGREVYDNVSVIYHYPNGVKMTFESIISNKHYGMDEQILGSLGTMEMAHGKFYREMPLPKTGIKQFLKQIEQGFFQNSVFAGTSWAPETGSTDSGEIIPGTQGVHDGASTVGAAGDGSKELIEAFCHATITGQQPERLVEEAYYACILALMGVQAMEEQRIVPFPEEYKIPYL